MTILCDLLRIARRARRTARARCRGAGTAEMLIVVGVLSVSVAGTLVAAGERLHRDYRHDRRALASPYP